MNRLSWFANRIRGLEPRSATPAASSIVLAKSDGTIDRGWTPIAAWTDTANTFTDNITIHKMGSQAALQLIYWAIVIWRMLRSE